MRFTSISVACLSILLSAQPLVAATPAQNRVAAAAELKRTFDGSLLKNLELKFVVRGTACDVLNVEGYNLYPEMMEALANGTVIYGTVLPGGVNAFASRRSFRDMVYTNRADKAYVSYGPSKLGRAATVKLRTCTDAIAASVTAAAPVGPAPTAPPFVKLSWAAAKPGQKLYNASFKHEATIEAVDKPAGIITVTYVRNGSTEPKRLDAVAGFWYVRK